MIEHYFDCPHCWQNHLKMIDSSIINQQKNAVTKTQQTLPTKPKVNNTQHAETKTAGGRRREAREDRRRPQVVRRGPRFHERELRHASRTFPVCARSSRTSRKEARTEGKWARSWTSARRAGAPQFSAPRPPPWPGQTPRGVPACRPAPRRAAVARGPRAAPPSREPACCAGPASRESRE